MTKEKEMQITKLLIIGIFAISAVRVLNTSRQVREASPMIILVRDRG